MRTIYQKNIRKLTKRNCRHLRLSHLFILLISLLASSPVFAETKLTNGIIRAADTDKIYLPRTGRFKCYDSSGAEMPCAGTGQDGGIKTGFEWPISRFEIKDNCVVDNLTGLMWTKSANLPNVQVTWEQTFQFISSMNEGERCGSYTEHGISGI